MISIIYYYYCWYDDENFNDTDEDGGDAKRTYLWCWLDLQSIQETYVVWHTIQNSKHYLNLCLPNVSTI